MLSLLSHYNKDVYGARREGLQLKFQEEKDWWDPQRSALGLSFAGSYMLIGVAQQWYDDLDNLAFSTPESETTVEDSSAIPDVNFDDGRVHIDCAVNTSPGTSEVIICAAFYLKLRRHPDLRDDSREKYGPRIADILNPGKRRGMGRDCIQLLLKSKADIRDLIFMKPLHVRIKIDTLDHPKADNSKGIILTDSSIEVNVTLDT